MGIEQLPPQCLRCPNIIVLKTLAEDSKKRAQQAEAEGFDLETVMLLHGVAESIEATYEVLSDSKAFYARQLGCKGLDPINWRCSLDIPEDNLQV